MTTVKKDAFIQLAGKKGASAVTCFFEKNLLNVPVDTNGVVLEDYEQKILFHMVVADEDISIESFDLNEGASTPYATMGGVSLFVFEDAVENHLLQLGEDAEVRNAILQLLTENARISQNEVIITIQKDTVLDEHIVSLTATGKDKVGNTYAGYGSLVIQGKYIAKDGSSAPTYFDELFAWSNVESTEDVNTSPFGNSTEPNPAWSTSIPNNTSNLAYLWRKSIRHVLDPTTNTYSDDNPQYVRLTGTKGTSIHTRGQVANSSARGSGTATIIVEGGTQTITLEDGDAVTQLDDGHLYQWVTEGGGAWLDLGVFKGEPGKTYYTHIAWAETVTFKTPVSVTGQLNKANASEVTGYVITPDTSAVRAYMGYLVNESTDDPTAQGSELLYTWAYVKGKDGARGDFKSRVFCRTNKDMSTHTPTGGTYESPIPNPASVVVDGETVTWQDGIPTGTGKVWTSIRLFKGDDTATTWSAPVIDTDTETHDIEFSPSTTKPNAPTGSTPFADHSSEGWYDPNAVLPSGVSWDDMIWRAERKVSNGAYDGSWVISRIKGEKGDSMYGLDIDNEYDVVPTDSTGKISAERTLSTIVRFYIGSQEQDISNGANINVSGGPGSSIATFSSAAEPNSGKGRKLSWAFIAGQTMAAGYEVEITYTKNGVGYHATFTMVASKGQAIFQLKPTPTSLPCTRNESSGTWNNPDPASLKIVKIDGVGTSETNASGNNLINLGVIVRYSTSSMPSDYLAGNLWPTDNSVQVTPADQNLYIAMFDRTTHVLLDRESIPVVKDGPKGDTGGHGGNTATVYLYKRLASAPQTWAMPTIKLWYDFAAKKLYTSSTGTTPPTPEQMNGWSLDIPTDNTNPIYVTAAIAYSTISRDDIETNEWASPAPFTENGEHGINSAPVFIYKRYPTRPEDKPTGYVRYTFADGSTVIESGKSWNGWQTTIPENTDNNHYPCWVRQAAALGTEATDDIEVNDWSDVRKLMEDGATPVPVTDQSGNTYWYINGQSTGIRANAEDGRGIETTKIEYGVSDSPTTLPTTWTEDYDEIDYQKGQWAWTRYTITYTDETTDVSYNKSLVGKDGLGAANCFLEYDVLNVPVDPSGKTLGAFHAEIPFYMVVGKDRVGISECTIEEGGTTHYASLGRPMLFVMDEDADVVNHTLILTKGAAVNDAHTLLLDSDKYCIAYSSIVIDIPANVQLDEHIVALSTIGLDYEGLEHFGYDSLVIQAKGADGDGIESITRTYNISAQGTTGSETTAPSDISTWETSSPAVTAAKPFLWAREVVDFKFAETTTKYYMIGARGDNGIDAQDAEWAYIRTKSNVAPVVLNDSTYTDHNGKTYTSDDHLPHVDSTGRTDDIEDNNSGSASKPYECTDDPKGVSDTWPYEWQIKRTKGDADATTHKRAWLPYGGSTTAENTMTLHNNYAESLLTIDIDNDNDQFGVDADGKVLVQQTKSTNVKMYYGTQDQAFTAAPTATLKYNDGTSVPSTVAEVGVDPYAQGKKSYAMTVTIKATGSNTPVFGTSGKSGLYVDISGTCAKGTKSIRFSLEKVMSGAAGVSPVIYQLSPTQKSFSFGRGSSNNLTPASRSSQINVAKTEGNTTTILSTAQTGITYKWGWDESATAQETGKAVGTSVSVSNTDAASHNQVWVQLVRDGVDGDRETLPIVKDGAKGDAGKNSVRLAIDNEHEDFLYRNDGTLIAPKLRTEGADGVRITSTLYDGGTPVSWQDVGWCIDTTQSSGTDIKNDGNPTTNSYTGNCAYIEPGGELNVVGISADTAKIVIKAKYPNNDSGQYYYATFTANKTTGDKFDLVVSPNAIAYNPADYTTQRISVSATGIDAQGNTLSPTIGLTANSGIFRVFWAWVSAGGTIGTKTRLTANSYKDITAANCEAYVGIYFELRRYTSSTAQDSSTSYRLCDYETVEIAKSENGDDSYSIMANPLVVEINTDANGYVVEQSSNTHRVDVVMYKGGSNTALAPTIGQPSPFTHTGFSVVAVQGVANAVNVIPTFDGSLPAPVEVSLPATYGDVTRTIKILVVPNRKGQSGSNAIHLDLNNEMDAIQYAGGTKVGADVTSQATLYNGRTPITNGVTWAKDNSSTATGTVSNSGLVTVTGLPANALRGVIVVKATYLNVDYYATFTVDKLVDKPKYYLQPDKDIIAANTSVTSGSATLTIRVWKDEINANGGITRTNVSSLGTELKLFYQVNQYQPGSLSYSDGSGTITGIPYTDGQVVVWLTDSTGSSSSKVTGLLDYESVPVVTVQNGQPGEKGDAARQPYEWGAWEDFIASNSNTFVANKYESPYFTKSEEVTSDGVTRVAVKKWQWVGADGTFVPPNATPSTGQTRSTTPSSTDTNWELMVTDFKYLISEAQIAEYGKFGSGIFDGDYAFSQYGRIDGDANDIQHYKNFRPEFFKGQPYTMFEGSKNIAGNKYYDTSHMYSFGEIFLEEEINYTFNFTITTATSSLAIRFYDLIDGTILGGWSISGSDSRETNPPRWSNIFEGKGGRSYLLCVYAESLNGSVTLSKITVEASKAFKPNIYIDWLKGEIYSQLGRFVNVTVEGVINNLIIDIANATDAAKYGKIVENEVNPLMTTNVLWLNPLKVGSYVRVSYGISIGLPSAFYHGANIDSIEDGGIGMTLDEMRQCVGKRIFVMPNFVNLSQNAFFSGKLATLASGASIGMILAKEREFSGTGFQTTNDLKNIPQPSDLVSRNGYETGAQIARVPYYSHSGATSGYYYVLECCLGLYDGHECIYWEIIDGGQALTR